MSDTLKNLKISFIIPVLNGEKFIGKCLGHILAEKAPQDEVILVDNGSTDDTVRVARDYESVKILELPDITVATMRNRGVAASGGDLLAFIDSDVLISKGWREAAISALSDPEIKATGSICCLPEDSTWVTRAWWSFGRSVKARVNYINTGNLIVRREAFEAIGGFNERLVTDEDSDIGVRLNQRHFWMLDDPRIHAVHVNAADTLRDFIRKEMWHATSIVDVLLAGSLDKAMIMTFVFMACAFLSLLALPLIVYYPPTLLLILAVMVAVPVVTSAFRAVQYRKPRYFFHLIVLYSVFYSARTITIMRIVMKKGLGIGRGKGEQDKAAAERPNKRAANK